MIDQISHDVLSYPKIFHALATSKVVPSDVLVNGINPPADLIEFWNTVGGCDLFESETILLPDLDLEENVESITKVWRSRGFHQAGVVFHVGSFISLFQAGSRYISFSQSDYAVLGAFEDLDSWYKTMLRSEFAERYGMISPTYT